MTLISEALQICSHDCTCMCVYQIVGLAYNELCNHFPNMKVSVMTHVSNLRQVLFAAVIANVCLAASPSSLQSPTSAVP